MTGSVEVGDDAAHQLGADPLLLGGAAEQLERLLANNGGNGCYECCVTEQDQSGWGADAGLSHDEVSR